MAFCGHCGAHLDNGKFCPQCGAPVDSEIGTNEVKGENTPITKSATKLLVGIVAIALIAFGVYTLATTSNEPCDWCHRTPTKGYTMSDGSKSYVCADCRSECAWCGARATKHYENLLSMMVFVCDDCYHDIVD